jgi:hypothetical protein
LRSKLVSPTPSDHCLLRATADFSSLSELVDSVRSRDLLPGLLTASLKADIADWARSGGVEDCGAILEEADRVCAHVFSILGADRVLLPSPQNGSALLPWHSDFTIGYRWNPETYYRDIAIPYGQADIKIPWELSRFTHSVTLGQAYWLTGDETYASEFARQVEGWIIANPPERGVNWACTMDVAIRASNWIFGLSFFRSSERLSNGFWQRTLKSLLVHGRHIRRNLENRGIKTNHYLADLVGLLYLGVALPEFKEARNWREFAVRELEREIGNQIYEDGGSFESSVCYHRLSLEFFFFSYLVCHGGGIPLSAGYVERLKRAFEFIRNVVTESGEAPQIGDNDSGRLHRFGTRRDLDFSYLLAWAAFAFGDSRFAVPPLDFAPEAIWLFGSAAGSRWRELVSSAGGESRASCLLPDFGLAVLRGGRDQLTVSCLPNGQHGVGGHAHNDKLAVTLDVEGKPVLIDPGTYSYTANPSARNLLRSTAYHNTVCVDGEEQNRFEGSELFQLHADAQVRVNAWESTEEFDLLDAEHSGYERLDPPVTHRRRVLFAKEAGFWLIQDLLLGSGDHELDLAFHFAPGLVPKRSSNLSLRTDLGGIDLAVAPLDRRGLSLELTEGWVSPQYGARCRAWVAHYRLSTALPGSFCTLLCRCPKGESPDAAIASARDSEVVKWFLLRLEDGD